MSIHPLMTCSSIFSHVIYEAAVDVLGLDEAAVLLTGLESGVEIDRLVDLLQQNYGSGGGKGVAQRMGQAAFRYFLNAYGSELNLTSLDYRLMPGSRRLKTGLELVSRKLGEECGAWIDLVSDENAYYWKIHWKRDLESQEITHDFTFFLAGMAQELLSWSGGGRFYSVRELPDQTACVLKMDLKPLD